MVAKVELPSDYEACGECGFDHDYEYEQAHKWHTEHPCSYCNYTEDGKHELHCTTLDEDTVPGMCLPER